MKTRWQKLASTDGRMEARYAVSRRLNRFLYPRGFAVLSDHFYQPLPPYWAVNELRRCEIDAVARTVAGQAERVAALLSEHAGDFETSVVQFGYHRSSAQLGPGDAETLFSMVRQRRPRRVVEIGAGSSTAVIGAALDRNARDHGISAEFTSIDPFVAVTLPAHLHPTVHFQHLGSAVQDVDPSIWEKLDADDILFVDSSHVFKRGSDVEHEFLRIYPRLSAGVVVHIHDVFFPHDYPLSWTLERSQFWNEQYHLAAVLESSGRYEVIACLAAIHDHDPGLLTGAIGAFDVGRRPGSIWLRVTGDSVA